MKYVRGIDLIGLAGLSLIVFCSIAVALNKDTKDCSTAYKTNDINITKLLKLKAGISTVNNISVETFSSVTNLQRPNYTSCTMYMKVITEKKDHVIQKASVILDRHDDGSWWSVSRVGKVVNNSW